MTHLFRVFYCHGSVYPVFNLPNLVPYSCVLHSQPHRSKSFASFPSKRSACWWQTILAVLYKQVKSKTRRYSGTRVAITLLPETKCVECRRASGCADILWCVGTNKAIATYATLRCAILFLRTLKWFLRTYLVAALFTRSVPFSLAGTLLLLLTFVLLADAPSPEVIWRYGFLLRWLLLDPEPPPSRWAVIAAACAAAIVASSISCDDLVWPPVELFVPELLGCTLPCWGVEEGIILVDIQIKPGCRWGESEQHGLWSL